MFPVARRVLGASHEFTFKMSLSYAAAIVNASGATLDDVREAVNTLEETARTARQVLGGQHPTTVEAKRSLFAVQAILANARRGSTSFKN